MGTTEEIREFLAREFPQFKGIIEEVGDRGARIRRRVGVDDLRPGGTVSGPVLMAVADAAIYIAILGELRTGGAGCNNEFKHQFFAKTGAGSRCFGRLQTA